MVWRTGCFVGLAHGWAHGMHRSQSEFQKNRNNTSVGFGEFGGESSGPELGNSMRTWFKPHMMWLKGLIHLRIGECLLLRTVGLSSFQSTVSSNCTFFGPGETTRPAVTSRGSRCFPHRRAKRWPEDALGQSSIERAECATWQRRLWLRLGPRKPSPGSLQRLHAYTLLQQHLILEINSPGCKPDGVWGQTDQSIAVPLSSPCNFFFLPAKTGVRSVGETWQNRRPSRRTFRPTRSIGSGVGRWSAMTCVVWSCPGTRPGSLSEDVFSRVVAFFLGWRRGDGGRSGFASWMTSGLCHRAPLV